MRVACIGSRRLSAAELEICQEIGQRLVRRGHAVVTGGAIGADQAFARGGASIDPKQVHVWLPWFAYELGKRPADTIVHLEELEGDAALAQRNHPAWTWLRPAVRKLMVRNARIIMDSEYVVAWPGRDNIGPTGGTVHGMRCAHELGKKVLDLSLPGNVDRLLAKLRA
jgi:predicted Rossmann-fold nucleotide-binding protein